MQAVFRPWFGGAHGGAKSGAAGTDDDDVIGVIDDRISGQATAPNTISPSA